MTLLPGSTHSGTLSRIDVVVRRHPDTRTVALLLLTPAARVRFERDGGNEWEDRGGVWVCPDHDAESTLDVLRDAGLTLKEV